MVFREKDFNNPPSALVDSKWDILKSDLLAEKNDHKEKTSCYRDTTIDALSKLYKDKCAICERKRGTELQVDHYRPKKTRNNKTNTKYNQPGYYWLCYDWSNLIPLCSKCNQKKSNKFPLMVWSETKRISNHLNNNNIIGFNSYNLQWLQQYEKPYMINPELEKVPERHFSFQSDSKMKGRTSEGEETINICALNRKDLRRERLEFRQGYVNEIKEVFDEFVKNKDESELKGALKSIFRRIKSFTHQDKPHSLFHTYIYKYFYYFIGEKLPTSIRNKTVIYFRDFNS